MADEIIKYYKSRRNSACLAQLPEGQAVVKTFADEASFQRELEVYKQLKNTDLPCARVISTGDKTLVLSRLPGKTLVDQLEEQEASGIPQWDVWDKLVQWLVAFHSVTGLVMTDVNLRNFLYDEDTNKLYGLDFEECSPGSMMEPAAAVAAFIRTYKPENTKLKQEISQYLLKLFAGSYDLEVETLILESVRQEEMILQRRNSKI